MSHPEYRPAQKQRGRKLMLAFELVNTFSFSLLAGNLIILLLLRLGANSTTIGALSAFPYVALFFMPFAKGSVVKHGLVRTFGRAWTARYLMIIPIVFAPLLVAWNLASFGVWLVVGSYFMFQVMRGFGLVSINPLNNELSAGKDRGEFLSRKAMFTYASSIGAGILVSALLGPQAPLERYSLFMGLGIILGFIGCSLLFRIPEPPSAGFGAQSSFREDIRRGLADPVFRGFFVAVAAMIFVSSLGRPFLIVYAKQVCHFGDDAAMVLSVVGNLGAIAMGWLCRLVLDRMGAKPLLLVFAGLAWLVSLPLVLLVPPQGVVAWLFLSGLFFISTFAASGGDNASQAWFFVKTPPELQFNLGMFYYMVIGAAGVLGSFLGGVLLDGGRQWLEPFDGFLGRGSDSLVYSAFFGLIFILGIPVLVLLARIAPLGARPVVDTLSTIFSVRELQTIGTLRRLDTPSGIDDEERILGSIRESDSDLAVDEVLKRLGSPLYSIRNQALLILERLPVTVEVEDALMDQVRHHQFASAYRAARLLGQKGVVRAVPVLREALGSEDYFLQAWAAGALGELGDRDSRGVLERLLASTPQHLVLIHAIGALKQLAMAESYPAVMAVLARREVPAHLRDEVVFGLAGIAGMADWLYPRYLAFLEDTTTGKAHLLDELDRLARRRSKEERNAGMDEAPLQARPGRSAALLEDLGALVAAIDSDQTRAFVDLAGPLLVELRAQGCLPAIICAETRAALDNESIRQFIRFRYFVAALLVHSAGDLLESISR